MHKITSRITQIFKNPVVSNSSWGGISLLVQGILLSLYFILIARHYPTEVFADFIIANVLYQLISAFSTLGLSQWFIREITGMADKRSVVNRYFKLQAFSGIVFYLVNISLGHLLYDDSLVRNLTIFFGINIIFDNLINAIQGINISEFRQKRTFTILSIEAALKFSVTCLLFIFPLSIINLAIILVTVRFLTLNLFLNFGSSRLISLKSLLKENIELSYIKTLIKNNWPFIIIGSISIINWRMSTLIISKFLTKKDVADFEISFRLFSMSQMLPIVVSTTVFPVLIKYFKEKKISDFTAFYKKIHMPYFMYGLLAFTFVYSFIDYVLPFIFGEAYADTGTFTKQMFMTILVLPTAFLQANVLVSMKLERLDMWFNIIILILTLTFSFTGLLFSKSLFVINISIFTSFLIFHILQDIILIKRGISTVNHTIGFYAISISLVGIYMWLSKLINPIVLFSAFWLVMAGLLLTRSRWDWFSKTGIPAGTFVHVPQDTIHKISDNTDMIK